MADQQTEFRGWARVEVMGHQTHIGFVTTEVYGAAVMFRVDQPEVPEEDVTLEFSEWIDDGRCPAGSTVRRQRIEPVSVLIGAGSIYRIIPCTEEAALKAIRTSVPRPLSLVKLAECAAIEAPVHDGEYDVAGGDGY